MSSKRPIIWLSTQDWHDTWTRKQRFARMFARRGNRVLYVESPWHLLSCLRGLPRSAAHAAACLRRPVEVEADLFMLTPPVVLPCFQRWNCVNQVNARLVRPFIRRAARRLGMQDPLLWTYQPYSAPYVGTLGESFVVYDCVDEWSSFKGLLRPEVVARQEAELITKADVVFVTARKLAETKAKLARRIRLVPNAAEFEHFQAALDDGCTVPADLRAIPRPVVGFVGGVQHWLDFDLLEHLATARPDWSLVLIGPIGRMAPVGRLKTLPNVHLLGRRDYADLPSYLKGFDVCISPFKLDETAESVSPLKLFEYMAAGKPVVSVDMPEVRPFEGIVKIARSREEFVKMIEAEITSAREGDPARVAAIVAEARKHTWENRFREIIAELGEVVD